MALSARELGQHRFGFWTPPLGLNWTLQSSPSFVLNFPLTFSAAVKQLLLPAPEKAEGQAAAVTHLLPGGTAGSGAQSCQGGHGRLGGSQCFHGMQVRAGHMLPGEEKDRMQAGLGKGFSSCS